MSLALRDSWVWDFWLADDGTDYHLFFLFASKALHDPEARHLRAGVGHAVSADLRTWTRVEDALVHGQRGDFDESATWTGSVVQGPDGLWRMFYTGARATDAGVAQTIGVATSPDLLIWTKSPDNPLVVPDPALYDTLPGTADSDAWRDPWVFADPNGDGWHMLITARASVGAPDDRGVIGHAWSPDLSAWEVRQPLSAPGVGFPCQEVPQVETVHGQPVVLFSFPAEETTATYEPEHPVGGIWAATTDSVTGPYDLSRARQIVTDGRYSGRLVWSRADESWVLLAFDRDEESPTFLQISDPMPVDLTDLP